MVIVLIYCLQIQTVQSRQFSLVYEDFYENKNLFYFSDYSDKLFDPADKKVIGKMKNEIKEKIINEFVGLISKMYFLVIVNNKEINKAKDKNIVKKTKHKKYVDVLFNKILVWHKIKRSQTKLNDKKYILDDGMSRLVYFHNDLRSH